MAGRLLGGFPSSGNPTVLGFGLGRGPCFVIQRIISVSMRLPQSYCKTMRGFVKLSGSRECITKGPHEFEADAISLIEEVERKTQLDVPDTTVDTVGGLLAEHFGHIPGVNETLSLGGYDFSILEAEPTRIRRILMKRASQENPTSPAVPSESSVTH